MSRAEARYQSLASCGAILIVYIAICHEFVGHIVFPWGPALFGGPAGWHALGLFGIALGLLLLCGTLRVFAFPVLPWALVAAAIGLALTIFTAVAHHEFHMFAFTFTVAAIATAICHRKASRLAETATATSAQYGAPAIGPWPARSDRP